jgi:pyruvate formate lyase activating enzyme
MKIKGLQKLTLLDYPGRLAATIFLGGCNMRCPFCHNASLVVRPDATEITEEELFAFLESRRGKLSGVCVTGGEPTLNPELPSFISKIRALGYSVKLDTNGTNPDMLATLIDGGLVDYVAMDIKTSIENYGRVSGVPNIDTSKIERSIDLILRATIPYEFRTTVVRELHTAADFYSIGRRIEGARAYFLQSFKDSGDLIEDGFSSYSEAEISSLLDIVKVYIPNAQIRG